MDQRRFKAIYTCDTCGKQIVTLDEENRGFKSTMIGCLATDRCPGTMKLASQGFDSALVADWEWFKPLLSLRRPSVVRDYVYRGGLDLRRIKTNRRG